MALPGPDLPRRRVPKPLPKPKVPRTTKGNVYTSKPPPRRRPVIPKTTARPVAPKPTGTTPAVNLGKYGAYAGIPGAINALNQIDSEQAAHQSYVNQAVAPWLSAALTGLAQFNTNAQNDYLRNIQGGAVAGAIAPGQIAASSPGGVVQGDNSYLTGAGQQHALGQGNAAQQIAAYQSTMNKLQPTTLSQGFISAFADRVAGLPELYSQRRSAYIDKLNGYLAETQAAAARQAEIDRHNRVTEAISATNAQTNAAFQASRLGLSASGQAFDQASQTTAASTPAPPGYLRDPATGKLYRDPSVPQASSSKPKSPKAAGQYDPNTLAKQGFVGGWRAKPKKLPAGAKSGFVQGTDGKWYVKPGTAKGGSTAKPYTPRTSTALQSSLGGYWKAGGTGGIEARYTDNPKGAGTWLAQWVRDNKRDFVVPGQGRKADLAKLRQVLASIGGRPAAEAISILIRGYISPDGTWK